jgi:hypothetical protein
VRARGGAWPRLAAAIGRNGPLVLAALGEVAGPLFLSQARAWRDR